MRLAGIKAVLFDLHGTLARKLPGADLATSLSSALLDLGVRAYLQKVRACLQYVIFVDYLARRFRTYGEFLSLLLHRLGASLPRDDLEGLEDSLRQQVLGGFHLYEDAVPALRELRRRGYRTGIVTTTPKFMFERAIGEIAGLLDAIVTGYEAMCDKSDPAIYSYATSSLGIKPSQAVMVGNDPELDVRNPMRLGLRAVLLNRERRVEVVEEVLVISRLLELLDILPSLAPTKVSSESP